MQALVDGIVLGYFVLLCLAYLALLAAALRSLARLRAERRLQGERRSPWPITLMVPAHNEAATVVESVRALLRLDYPQFEVVVVNDGSRDATLARLHESFGLVPDLSDAPGVLPCRPVRSRWRSSVEPRLRVLDKHNGGKADALNCAINASRSPLICAIDADTLILPDALHRLARPFHAHPELLAVGGTIGLANGARVRRGVVLELGAPRGWLARFQVVEYLRAFLIGRLGWNLLGGNVIISGAFGLFRRSAVVAAGGYARDTVGEDMELVARLRRFAPPWQQAGAVVHLPDPVAFTEAPESWRILGNQRDRWQRGLADTLWRCRDMIGRPRFGALGLVVLPFFVLFELGGPVVELFGYGYFGWLAGTGRLHAGFAALFLAASVGFGFALSIVALVLERHLLGFFRQPHDMGRLALAALAENVGYRQVVLYFRLRGLWNYVRGNKAWGGMVRAGFRPA
jgi:cellulose synthase/poly-beta-1,6-N-acetylglucosamine synthase-like glycosyltransferase